MTNLKGKCKQWAIELMSTLDMDAMIAAIKAGEPLDLEGYKLTNPGPGPDTKLRFYTVENGVYGQPLVYADPELAIELPKGLTYVTPRGDEVKPTEKLAGFIITELDGSVSYRYSLTNATSKGGVSYGFDPDDNSFKVDGKTYWVHTLFSKDKNRVINYDAFCTPVKTTRVSMIELADLRFGVKTA